MVWLSGSESPETIHSTSQAVLQQFEVTVGYIHNSPHVLVDHEAYLMTTTFAIRGVQGLLARYQPCRVGPARKPGIKTKRDASYSKIHRFREGIAKV